MGAYARAHPSQHCPARERYARAVRELVLHHRRAGKGEPLLAIHGIGSTWQVWEPVLPMLEARHDVLSLSLPGFGESPALVGQPTVPALVDSVEDAMDAAGIARAHLVGNSLGGWITAELAARGRARSVAAICPAGLWTPREMRYATTVLNSLRETALRLEPFAERICANAVGRRLAFGAVASRPERIDPESAVYQVRMMAGSESFPQTLSWLREGHQPEGLDRIACPFTVLWGTKDRVLPRRQGVRWTEKVRSAELVELSRLGHVPMSDDPGGLAKAILAVTGAATARQ